MSNQRVKVRVVDLIERIEAAKAASLSAHNKAMEKYLLAKSTYTAKVEAALNKAVADLQGGKLPDHGYNGLTIRVRFQEPVEPVQRGSFDRDLNLLRMAHDETLTISLDSDFGKYL